MPTLSLLNGWSLTLFPPVTQISLTGVQIGFSQSHRVTIEADDTSVSLRFEGPQPTLTRTFNSVFADWLLHDFATVTLGRIRMGLRCGIEVYDGQGKLRGAWR